MNKTKTVTLILILAILVISILCQSSMYIGANVGWRLHITQIFLTGGQYVSHFMDANPPILMYEFIPAALLSKWTGLNAIISLRLIIYIIGICSLVFCYKLHELLFSKKEASLKAGFMAALAIIFFLAPAMEFGQREHWILLLSLPYFLNASLVALNKKGSRSLSFWVGLFAAFAFITNIDYFAIFLVIECYLAFHRGSLKTLLRIEPLLIVIVAVLYMISLFLLAPNYLNIILPISMLLSDANVHFSWRALLNNSTSIAWAIALIFFPFHYKNTDYKSLYFVLLIPLIGFYIHFVLSQKIWFFHMLPTLSICLLMLTLYIFEDMRQLRHLKRFNIKIEIKFLAVSIFMYATILILPIRDVFVYNRNALAYRNFKGNEINLIIKYVKNAAEGKTIYVFSTTKDPAITLMNYANVKIANKMPGFWMIPNLLQLSNVSLSPSKTERIENARKLLFNTVMTSFQQSKPDLVIVQTGDFWRIPNQNTFSYIQYFSQDARFKKIWSHYHFVYQINEYAIFIRQKD